MNFEQAVVTSFAALTPNLAGIELDAQNQSLSTWRKKQQAMVTGSGAVAAAIPGVHLVGMAADVAFLMNRMATCCYGIGAILAREAGCEHLLEDEDFAIILARWSGDESLSDDAIRLVHAELVQELGHQAISKVLAREMAKKTGILVGKKLASKVTAKIAAKFGAKLGSKALAGFIPVLGAAASGGINLWFITSIANAAEGWFRLKVGLIKAGA